jgi:antitoxin (DNA-binding transcriptional repressor) of toxin-antitoxin stability system
MSTQEASAGNDVVLARAGKPVARVTLQSLRQRNCYSEFQNVTGTPETNYANNNGCAEYRRHQVDFRQVRYRIE